jgi:hypothetical protein
MAPSRGRRPYRDPAVMTADELRELNARYWQSDQKRDALLKSSGLSPNDFQKAIKPLPTSLACSRCTSPTVWMSRSARLQERARCESCRHWSAGPCTCDACKADEAEWQRADWQADTERRRAARSRWEGTYVVDGYVDRAIKELSPSPRALLEALRLYPDMPLDEVAWRAGLDARRMDLHLNRLILLGLVFDDGRTLHVHPDVQGGPPLLLR